MKHQKTDFPSSFTMNGRELTDSLEIANEFNIFFANVGINSSVADATGVDTHCEDFTYSDYLNNPTVHRFKFVLVSENDIIAIITQMEGKCSSGIDELSNKLLKSITYEISKPLAIIINQSLETGIFPEMLKIAKIKPLYKKGDSSCFNNYRPISLLSTISKVFERVIHTQLFNYFDVNDLFMI